MLNSGTNFRNTIYTANGQGIPYNNSYRLKLDFIEVFHTMCNITIKHAWFSVNSISDGHQHGWRVIIYTYNSRLCCCCFFVAVNFCSHILCFFCVRPLFYCAELSVLSSFAIILGREGCLLCFYCLLGVLRLLLFFASSSHCRWLVCSVYCHIHLLIAVAKHM